MSENIAQIISPQRDALSRSEYPLKPSFSYQASNPFSTQSTSPGNVAYRFAPGRSGNSRHAINTGLETLLGKVEGARRCVIVGPHGTGKSTLLQTLLPKLQEAFPKVVFQQLSNDPSLGYFKRVVERIQASKRIRKQLYTLPKGGLAVIDGWEQLSWLARRRIASSALTQGVTLLVTSHRRMPSWTLIHETRISPEMVRSLAMDLLQESPHNIQKLVESQIKSRTVNSQTNVRDLWFELYDVVEDAQQRGYGR